MQQGEVIRSVSATLVGIFLLFLVAPWLYKNTGLTPLDVDLDEWIPGRYIVGAVIVFAGSVVAQVLWLYEAIRYTGDHRNAESKKIVWWRLLFIPVVCIGIALYIAGISSQGSNDAFPSLIFIYTLAGGIIYWFATAISTPGYLMLIPPKALEVRNLIGLNK